MRKIKGIVCVAALAAAVGCLNGCSFSIGMKSSYKYSDSEKYAVGDVEITDKIDKLDIDYLSGDVKIVKADTDKITIEETAKKELDDKRKVHTWVEGSTLHVKFCESGKGLDLNNLDKKLEITIPEDLVFDDVVMDMASGDINANIDADNYDIESASGSVFLYQTGNSSEMKIETASGDVEVDLESADVFSAHTASGEITVNAKSIRDFKAETASGDHEYHLDVVPESADISSASGYVHLYFPEKADIKADFDTASGDIFYELPFTKNGDKFVCGEGTNTLKVETASGDIRINQNN
jgi:DUF4097 and DUF4098 domain-containing protein YvlB